VNTELLDPTFCSALGIASLVLLGICLFRFGPALAGSLFGLAAVWFIVAPAGLGDPTLAAPSWLVVMVLSLLVVGAFCARLAPGIGATLAGVAVATFLFGASIATTHNGSPAVSAHQIFVGSSHK
jgi:hypothetical protein